jgi:hypothetical protein
MMASTHAPHTKMGTISAGGAMRMRASTPELNAVTLKFTNENVRM